MIVVVKMNTGNTGKQFKKCMIRDRVFHEVDTDNKKIKDGQIKTSAINSVISLKDGAFTTVPVDEWLSTAQEHSFWNAT